VVLLSNNDGCCVARSDEAKALAPVHERLVKEINFWSDRCNRL
jgi:hypothetical protein